MKQLIIFMWFGFQCSGAALAASQAPAAANTEWRLIGANAGEQHFSELDQINESNIKDLGIAWFADMPTPDGMVGTPLVADGTIYQSGSHSIVYANDARTGKLLWSYDPRAHGTGVMAAVGVQMNRGLALWEDLVIVGTGDCRLLAVDRTRGTKKWEVQVCDNDPDLMITAPPRVGAGKVFTGNANGDLGTRRGYVDAYDARTGKHLWRFYTVPGDPAKGFESPALKMAAATWGKEWWKRAAGGSVWEAINYDPTLNMLYIGVGSPSPFNPKERGADRGDELFTNSIVALNADTGEYVWHYQTTPNDAWDLEPVMHMVTADIPIDGQRRHVLMQAPKNGFFYVLDAKTGKLLSANNFVPVNWASRIDMKSGRPVELPGPRYYDAPDGQAVVQPGIYGAHSYPPMSFSPKTGLAYIPAMEMKALFKITRDRGVLGGDVRFDQYYDLEHDRGRLIAWDPVSQQARWSVDLPTIWNGGVMSTAGNLVFQGTASGEFRVYRATDGKLLWSKFMGSGVMAPASTVMLDGTQYIILPIGNGAAAITPRSLPKLVGAAKQPFGPARLVALKLNGHVEMSAPAVTLPPFEKPPRPRPDPVLARRGDDLFELAGCDICHGKNVEAQSHGSVPDLRRLPESIHAILPQIVLGGQLSSAGMPSFKGQLSETDLKAIQAYILDRAWAAYDSQNAKASRH
jgi:quinohemoprotein ethanol dehydrogenase